MYLKSYTKLNGRVGCSLKIIIAIVTRVRLMRKLTLNISNRPIPVFSSALRTGDHFIGLQKRSPHKLTFILAISHYSNFDWTRSSVTTCNKVYKQALFRVF